MALRNYSATAVGTTLTAAITTAGQATCTVAATTGFPAVPFIAVIDPDTTAEEVVLVTNVATLTLTITRGYDGTTAVTHLNGGKLEHSFSAIDFREPNTFLNSGGTIGGNVTISGTLNPTNAADTATAASHYWVETGSDGLIRAKTLANVKTEVVTTAAVNSAAATTVGTVTSGVWNAGAITTSGDINASAATGTINIAAAKTTGGITLGSGLTTGALDIAASGTGATPVTIGHTNATVNIVGTFQVNGAAPQTESWHPFLTMGS